ncbi:hypothetical protein DPMN_043432 [Dreissena polymorpha]|uniref:C2H2-type domain-containing protein n=1 Tax=Dreissena polymorpha TaxID=45954 RepID=A0A9D4D2C5_DREPO|nr:hypothetical protein DPMN_043432 [Dreissena polymorpha]
MGEECFQYTIVEDLALPEELQSFVCKQCNEFFLSEEEFQNHTANQCFRFESNQQQKNETITNTSGENGCSPLTD